MKSLKGSVHFTTETVNQMRHELSRERWQENFNTFKKLTFILRNKEISMKRTINWTITKTIHLKMIFLLRIKDEEASSDRFAGFYFIFFAAAAVVSDRTAGPEVVLNF